MTHYAWENRAYYTTFTVNELIDAIEKKTGRRLEDDVRDAIIQESSKAIRGVILDVVEVMER
jgi:hypothetical protein